MQNSVVGSPKPAPRIETQPSVSIGGDVIVCPEEGLQQMCQRAYLLAPRLDHAMCDISYWGHNLKRTLPSWSSRGSIGDLVAMVKGYVDGQFPFPTSDSALTSSLCPHTGIFLGMHTCSCSPFSPVSSHASVRAWLTAVSSMSSPMLWAQHKAGLGVICRTEM